MADFWKLEYLVTDRLNADIWEKSPGLQRQIQSPQSLLKEGAVGAQQAMVDGVPDDVLPWVPDIIGDAWKDEDSILIVGSAYAGFIKEYSNRKASMSLASYCQAQTVEDFQQQFFQRVVEPDRSYYGKIPFMLPEGWNSSKIALFDLCRASFVQRSKNLEAESVKRRDIQGDKRIREQPHIFQKYIVDAQATEWTWTWKRITQSRAYRIVALGTIAEHGLLRLFASHGMKAFIQCQPKIQFGPAHVTTSVNWPLKYAGRSAGKDWQLGCWYDTDSYWVIEGIVGSEKRTWYMRPTNHPADVHSETHPSLAATRSALAAMEQMRPPNT